MTRRGWLGAASLAVMAQAASAQQLHYEGALSLTSGTYIFAERTNSWTLSTGLAFATGPVTVRGTVPMFLQNTTLLTSSGGVLVPTGGSSRGTVSDSSAAGRGRGGGMRSTADSQLTAPLRSLAESSDATIEVPSSAVTGYEAHAGDPLVGATAAFGTGRTGLLIGVNAKVPLSDTTGYGTGAWDFGGSASLSYLLGRTTTVSVDAGYWIMGDLPDLDLKNPLLLSATVSYLGLAGWGVFGSLSSASPVIEGVARSTLVSVSMLRVGGRRTAGLTVGIGLSELAPDITVGLSWRMRLAGR